MIRKNIDKLINYAIGKNFLEDSDATYMRNKLLSLIGAKDFNENDIPSFKEEEIPDEELSTILDALCDEAIKTGAIKQDSITYRDLFDTKLMGEITPLPTAVRHAFFDQYMQDPLLATDWYYEFSQNTNYIRRDRIAKDMKWVCETEYGNLDITINLSKPEKDPKAIAAAKNLPKSAYPHCLLCKENEGYSGRIDHPARQNHRIIPIIINDSPWYFQYSPYVYYNEHCIVFNSEHTPMKIDRAAFKKLLDFVEMFPHYFVGSNADLPIVGGSILAHDHFQGGHYTFAMAKAKVETKVSFDGYEDVDSGIIKWPMSVIRIVCEDYNRLVDLADKILIKWRSYSDKSAFIFSETNGQPHNTITPIARKRNGKYELDLVLRNNITTKEHPLGVYHPHSELHHIKKENIGLIEVMGLAVLPARLKEELSLLSDCLIKNIDVSSVSDIAKHALWAKELSSRYDFTSENTMNILQKEVGKIFLKVLEHAGVYKRNAEGKAAFLRFIDNINEK